MRSAEGRVDAFKAILPAVEQVHDRIERAAIATEIAEQLGVDREMVRHSAAPEIRAAVWSQRPRMWRRPFRRTKSC